MKKDITVLIALMALCLMLVSCSDDDEDDQSLIVGTWTAQSATIDFSIDGQDLADFLVGLGLSEEEAEVFETALDDGEQEFSSGTVTFNADGTYQAEDDSEVTNGTWSVNSDNTVLTLDLGTADEQTANILTLSQSELVLQFLEEQMEDLDLDGDAETLRLEAILTLSR